MKKANYSLGVVLIFIGLMFLLMNLNVLTFDWLLFILAIGLIVWDLKSGNTVYLIAGLLLLGISSVALIDEYLFTTISVKSFIYQLIFGIISLVMYKRHSNKGFLVLGPAGSKTARWSSTVSRVASTRSLRPPGLSLQQIATAGTTGIFWKTAFGP